MSRVCAQQPARGGALLANVHSCRELAGAPDGVYDSAMQRIAPRALQCYQSSGYRTLKQVLSRRGTAHRHP